MPFLFEDVIFGPVRSRRLGLSLGINLLPGTFKHCSFNCIYCECGWTPRIRVGPSDFPQRSEVSQYLRMRLLELASDAYLPDAITYAGNGEPTLHPEFPGIVEDTLLLRDELAPGARVAVLSNASRIHDPGVFQALMQLDCNIQKLDAGTERLFRLMNQPIQEVNYKELIDNLVRFNGRVIIQSMFLQGTIMGIHVDNTVEEEIKIWLDHLVRIRPSIVMIYSIARAAPVHTLERVSLQELDSISKRVQEAGLIVKVYE